MKVKDLIAQLNKLDPEMAIYGFDEETGSSDQTGMPLYEFGTANAVDAEIHKGADNRLRATLMAAGEGRKIVLLDLTAAMQR
jgi:hypothetical protein